MQLITQAYPSPFPSLSMCAPRSAVSIFIVKVKMQTDAALQFGYVSFASSTSSLSSSYSASLLVCMVRFVGFIINEGFLFAVLRCFVFAASSGFIFLQCLFLFLSLFLLSCVHAIFAHLLRFVEHSHRCLGIPSLAFTIFAVHCGTVDFLSGHWTVEGSTGEEGSAALFVQF